MPKFLDAISDPAKKAVVEDWLKALKGGGDDCKIIALNYLTDPNVSVAAADSFAAILAGIWKIGSDFRAALAILQLSLPSTIFCHPVNGVRFKSDSGSRLMTLQSFLRFHDPLGAFTTEFDDGSVTILEQHLRNLSAGDLIGTIRGVQACSWWTWTDAVAHMSTADEIRDALGLLLTPALPSDPDAFKQNTLLEIMDRSIADATLSRPTVIEANSHTPFLPSAAGSGSGLAQDLGTGAPSSPEYVQGDFPAHEVTGPVENRGVVTTNPPDNWKAMRMSAYTSFVS